jgi:hypothetical protein
LGKKTTTPAAAPVVRDPLPALADELGALEKELAPLAGKITRAEALRKEIRIQTPDNRREIAGEKFLVTLGERGNQTVVDYPALAKKIGFEKYASIATATLKALALHVAPGILARFVRTEQTGPRSLKVFEKGQVSTQAEGRWS